MITAKEIEAQFTTLNENGELVAFDFDGFSALVTKLYKDRTTIRENNKEEVKAQKAAENAKLAEVGKAYYDSLSLGAEFSYKDSKGEVHLATKIETKSGSSSTAACTLVNKTTTKGERYPKFHTVVVPTEFAEAYNAKRLRKS